MDADWRGSSQKSEKSQYPKWLAYNYPANVLLNMGILQDIVYWPRFAAFTVSII